MIKGLLKKLTISTAIIIWLVAALSISAGAIVTWHSERADSGRKYPEGIGYDALGNPGIAQMDYFSNPYKASYRYKSASGWVSETIGDASNAPALAFNSAGQPSVLYVRYADSTYYLIYAKRTAANIWQETTVESVKGDQGRIEGVYSLAFNSSGNPSVSYVKTTRSPYSDTLYYAAYNGSSWQKQAIYSANDTFYSDITFNGSTPAIAFSAGRQGLKYAYLSSGKWTVQTVDDLASTLRFRNRQSDITLGFGNGKPLISYNDKDTQTLKFAYYLDGSWTIKTVEASTSDRNYTGDYATMQVSQGASGYVVYLVHSNFVVNGTTSVRLKTLAVNSDADLTATGFVSQTVYTANFGNMYPLLTSAIKDGNPSIAFLDYWRSNTSYISMQPDLLAVSSVSFGAAAPESSSSRDVTITNNGSLNLSISEIMAPSAPFGITRGEPGSLSPGQSRVITVHFEPTAAGVSSQGTLSIKSNDPDHPVFNISLSGRSIGNNANLTGLNFSNGTSMTLLPDDAERNLTVAYATGSLKITPTAAHVHAQIRVQGTVVQSGAASDALPLGIGENTVEIVVTSEDGKTVKTYTLNITRLESPDASLSELTVSAGILSPEFSPEILTYSMTLPDGVSSFSFTPTAAQGGSTISINETPTPNGSESVSLAAEVGRNTYTLRVVAPDDVSTMDYVVTVFRLPEISGISLDHGVLDTDFDPYDLSYTAAVPNSAVTTKVTATADAAYRLKVNGAAVASAEASAAISLETGENIITIEVISSDEQTSRTYTLTVRRLPGLTSLSVGDSFVFYSQNEFEFSVYITEAECPIIFTAPDGMSVDITKGITPISASENGISEPISFKEGLNGPFTIKLTSPECDEKTVYSLTVFRYPLLTSLEIEGSEIETWPDEYFYMQTVANTCESAVIKAAVNSGTTVVPDGNYTFTPVAGQTNTWTVENLRVGGNPVYLRLTSSDGQAEMMYDFSIQRLPGLSELSVDGETLSPVFNVNTYDYTVNVGREVSTVTLNAETSEEGYSLSINGIETLSDSLTHTVVLSYGSNIIPVVVSNNDYYNVNAVYNVNVIREEPEAGVISPASASFDKYASAVGHKDISVTVTSDENPLLAVKNGGSTLVAETDYTVSGNTYTIKKEYLLTLPAGQTSLTFDFAHGADPMLSVTISDSNPANIGGGGTSTPPGYNAGVSGGSDVPVTVNTGTGNAAVNIGPISSGIAGGANMVVEVPPIPGVNSYTANIPSSALSASEGGSLTLNTNLASVTILGNMLSGVGLTGDAGVTISEGGKENLPDDVKSAIGDRPLIQLTLSIDGKQTKWSNEDAPVTVSVPYTPTREELAHPERIVIWYIDGSGNATCVTNGSYNSETGTVTFSTTHFSDYAVVYNPVSFSDANVGAWYYKAVNYLAAREITNGTGGGNFSPDAKLTRGEFIVMLMRAYGIASDEAPTDNFSDAGSTYYTGYLAAAKRLGLSDGVGKNQYAPEREITRQEMFTLLYNTLRAINRLPQGDSFNTISDFTDSGQIESWAVKAVTLLVETGTVEGSAGKLYPTGTATRAEMAQMVYKLQYLMGQL